MGLLKLTNDIPGVTSIDYRDKLYYSKYEYRVRITIRGLSRGHYFSPNEFEERFKKNTLWGRMGDAEKAVIANNMPAIKQTLAFKHQYYKNKDVTVRVEGNTFAVFGNDLQFLHDQFDNLSDYTPEFTKVETSGFKGTLSFAKEPKYKYRVFFRSKRVDESFRPELKKIIEKNTKLRPSPALKSWINTQDNMKGRWWYSLISAHFFIDYNEESYLSYLTLVYGDQLGKKYKLQKRPDIV
jgi:hypothetical protein